MSTITLQDYIGDKNRSFDNRLTLNYWLTKALSFTVDFLEGYLSLLTKKTLFRVEEIKIILQKVYNDADSIEKQEAQKIYPIITELRKTITKQNGRFASIEYGKNKELKNAFISLVRLINRTESRVHRQLYKDNDKIKTPLYIKEKMASNSKKIVGNAILQEADH